MFESTTATVIKFTSEANSLPSAFLNAYWYEKWVINIANSFWLLWRSSFLTYYRLISLHNQTPFNLVWKFWKSQIISNKNSYSNYKEKLHSAAKYGKMYFWKDLFHASSSQTKLKSFKNTSKVEKRILPYLW